MKSKNLGKMKTPKSYKLSEDVIKTIDQLAEYTRSSQTRIIEVAIMEYGKLLPPNGKAEKKKKKNGA